MTVRVLILLATVLDLPVLARGVCLLTRAPRSEQLEIDGVAVEIVKPAGKGPWPAWLFVNGAHPLRRTEPVVRRLALGLARAGYLVVTPDLPGLGEGRIAPRTLEATTAVTRAAFERPDVLGGRVALIGASTGAGLALLVAASPECRDRVSVVAAVAPFADIERMVCLVTTCFYEEENGHVQYGVTDLHRRVVAGSLVTALPAGADRERLLSVLDHAEAEGLDPLEQLASSAADLGGEAAAVVRVLSNRDPHRFRELFGALPAGVLRATTALSPVHRCEGLQAPAEIVVPPTDEYFPLGEARALSRLPNVRLTVTKTLDHTRPQASLANLRDLRRFLGFVTRGLAAATRERVA